MKSNCFREKPARLLTRMPGKRKNTATAGEVATALFIPEKGVMRIVVDKDHVMEDGTRFA